MRHVDSVLHSLSSDPSNPHIVMATPGGWGSISSGPEAETARVRKTGSIDAAATSVGIIASVLLAAFVGVGFFLAFAKMIASETASFYGLTILVPMVSILAGTTLVVGLRGAMINSHFLVTPFALLGVYFLAWFGRLWLTYGIVKASNAFYDPIEFVSLVRSCVESDVPFLSMLGPNWIPIFVGTRVLLVMFACLAFSRLIFGKDN